LLSAWGPASKEGGNAANNVAKNTHPTPRVFEFAYILQ
jgi:hypothetical protein